MAGWHVGWKCSVGRVGCYLVAGTRSRLDTVCSSIGSQLALYIQSLVVVGLFGLQECLFRKRCSAITYFVGFLRLHRSAVRLMSGIMSVILFCVIVCLGKRLELCRHTETWRHYWSCEFYWSFLPPSILVARWHPSRSSSLLWAVL
jgi:hypothetical protein